MEGRTAVDTRADVMVDADAIPQGVAGTAVAASRGDGVVSSSSSSVEEISTVGASGSAGARPGVAGDFFDEEIAAHVPEGYEAPAGAVYKELFLRYSGKYTGFVLNGKRHGFGTFVNLAGDTFTGPWVNGKREGRFKCTYTNGETFDGVFVKDRRHGPGAHVWPDGKRYTGEYENDRRHGPGMFVSKHDYYECQKMYMRRYENGVLVDEREVFTEHQLISDKPGFGFGVWVNEEGIRYEGEHENHLRHGDGILTFPDGTEWIGPFADNVRHGIGMRRTPMNEYFYETYEAGVLIGDPVPSDIKNWDNMRWFDEGGQRQ